MVLEVAIHFCMAGLGKTLEDWSRPRPFMWDPGTENEPAADGLVTRRGWHGVMQGLTLAPTFMAGHMRAPMHTRTD